MAEPVGLRTDGPHSPDYTREVGNALAEAVRVLNYATSGSAPGLEYPSDAYSLLGALCTATGRLQQLCTQLRAFLRSQAASGALADDQGRDASAVVIMANALLGQAARKAEEITRALQGAQNEISGLSARDPEGSDRGQ